MIPVTNIDELRKKYASDNYMAFSVDVDWASDYCIGKIVGFFRERGIPLTVFCTHRSDKLESLKSDAGIERGIHPNFCGESSQGDTLDEVVDFCMALVPEARCMRAHRWYSSNDVYDRLIERGIVFDSNESSMLDLAPPYIHRSGVLRIPTYFEDGGFLWNGAKLDFKSNGEKYFDCAGLKVLDLHPIHFALNCPTQGFYRNVGDALTREEYVSMTAETAARIEYKGYGMRNYLTELVDYVARKKLNVVSLGQVYDGLVYYER